MDNFATVKPEKIWRVKPPFPMLARVLARELDVSLLTAQLLINRGIYTVEQGRAFLAPALEQMYDPWLMRDMDKAVARLTQALKTREKIVVYGDYDADGITATALLYLVLTRLGGDVAYYLPHRIKEGYGLHIDALARCQADGAALVVTVDCGINAFPEAAFCQAHGLALIITDHHEPAADLPEAVAVLNPKRADCGYPFKELAGVGVALKLAQALLANLAAAQPDWRDFLDLCCLGTIADVVPLRGENRIIVKHGLALLTASRRPGLAALVRSCGRKEPLEAEDVSFSLTPRLNAAGRMAQADLALELLLTDDPGQALEITEELQAGNLVRQEIGNNIYAEALGLIDGQPALAAARVIVLASRQWHPGVLGIVAARLAERFYRPVLLIALDEENIGKGSARSIPGFNLFEAIEFCREDLVKYGGHAQAAGITIKGERLGVFTETLNRYAAAEFTPEAAQPALELDLTVRLNQISAELITEIERLQPFGQDNPPPLLACRDAKVVSSRGVGREAAHLKLQLQTNEKPLDGIGFSFGAFAPLLPPAQRVDLAFNPEFNEYNGQRRLQLKIKDVGLPATVTAPPPEVADGVTFEQLSPWPEMINHLLYDQRFPAKPAAAPAAKLVDGRCWPDRLARLAELAAEADQLLVLTNSAAQTLGLSHYLRFTAPALAGKSKTLYDPAEPGLTRETARQFAAGEFPLLLTTPGLAASLGLKAAGVVSFFLPWSPTALQAVQAMALPTGRVYLLYNRNDLAELTPYLDDLPPARDLMTGFYTLLRRMAGANQKIVLNPEKASLQLTAQLGRPIRGYALVAATQILADVALLESEPNGVTLTINLLPAPKEKKDLQTSPTWQKLQKAKVAALKEMESQLSTKTE